MAKLAPFQSRYLWIIAGIYRAIPIYLLEVEVAIPPIDIYLNKRVADLKAQLERTGIGALIRSVCSEVAVKLQ